MLAVVTLVPHVTNKCSRPPERPELWRLDRLLFVFPPESVQMKEEDKEEEERSLQAEIKTFQTASDPLQGRGERGRGGRERERKREEQGFQSALA